MNPTVLIFDPGGQGHCLYSEAIDLHALGHLEIARASQIEFNNQTQLWEVLSLSGQVLFSNPSRSACLDWEHQQYK
jgi:hypothetical protein